MSIKTLWQSIRQHVKDLFGKPELGDKLNTCIHVTEWLKGILESPVAHLVVNSIPGIKDDIARDLAINWLDKALDKLYDLQSANIEGKIEEVLNIISQHTPDQRNLQLLGIASHMAKISDNNEESTGAYVVGVEVELKRGV